jgi:peptide/nickel transport system substrate-binding protein
MSFFKNLFFALTKKERIAFLTCSAAAIASFVVVASMLVAQATKAIPAPGGTYTEGVIGQPEYVNPVTAESATDLALVKLVYANIPDIADSITSSTDGMTWTVHLKSGLTWQDGQKLTSDDIIFTVQSIQDPDANSPLATSWRGVSANRVSELELTFTLANPYAFFGDTLADLYVAPKHIFADIPPGNWHLSDYNLKPIGAGPYEFDSYDEGADGFITGYHLAAWDGYVGQQANIKNIDLAFFRNAVDLIQGFNTGAIDGLGGISAAQLTTINRPYNVFAWRTPSYYAIFWNTSKNLALQDSAVRAALSAAIDRSALVTSALGGYGAPDTSPIPPNAKYALAPSPSSSSSTLSASSTAASSLPSATSLLDNAGWTITSSTFRSKTIQKTVVPLAVNLTIPDIDFLVATAQSLQATWQSIGVQVNIATDTPQNIVTNTIKNRSYEGLLFGNVLGPSSDLYSFWDSSQRFSPGLNLAIYDNSHVDSLIETARQNLSDASRSAELASAQSAIITDNPAVFLYSPDYLFVTTKNVQGIAPDLLVDPSDLSREMPGWYLNTARVLK